MRVRKVPGYNGFYKIREDGKIWTSNSRGGGIKTPGSFWIELEGFSNDRGYRYVKLHHNGKAKTVFVHRLVLLTFVGPCPPGKQARHLDGNPRNSNLSNLQWTTPKINQRDRFKHGTHLRGVRNPLAKLTEDQVREIRKKYNWKKGWQGNGSKLARKFGVHPTVIYAAVRRKTWKCVK